MHLAFFFTGVALATRILGAPLMKRDDNFSGQITFWDHSGRDASATYVGVPLGTCEPYPNTGNNGYKDSIVEISDLTVVCDFYFSDQCNLGDSYDFHTDVLKGSFAFGFDMGGRRFQTFACWRAHG